MLGTTQLCFSGAGFAWCVPANVAGTVTKGHGTAAPQPFCCQGLTCKGSRRPLVLLKNENSPNISHLISVTSER